MKKYIEIGSGRRIQEKLFKIKAGVMKDRLRRLSIGLHWLDLECSFKELASDSVANEGEGK